MSARVLIAGGGVAALEAAIALHEIAGERVRVEICSPREDFIYRPFAVAEPYGASRPMRYSLSRLAEHCGATIAASGSNRSTARRSSSARTMARRSATTT